MTTNNEAKKAIREAKAMLKIFAKNRQPVKESPYVRMAKVIVSGNRG
jgi:hypothetical protein